MNNVPDLHGLIFASSTGMFNHVCLLILLRHICMVITEYTDTEASLSAISQLF